MPTADSRTHARPFQTLAQSPSYPPRVVLDKPQQCRRIAPGTPPAQFKNHAQGVGEPSKNSSKTNLRITKKLPRRFPQINPQNNLKTAYNNPQGTVRTPAEPVRSRRRPSAPSWRRWMATAPLRRSRRSCRRRRRRLPSET
eukprot:6211382-Pleurochrysis_carterae.AAC.4